MQIEILGMGCAKCNKLEEMVKLAIEQTGINADINHIRDIKKITEYGVTITPALVIDKKVKAAGEIPALEEIKKMIT